ncbi:cytosine-specific methyltransferase [Oceaniferula spumae]|uniref:Cytosine-specific methyltransferase n=1 Tax=Oceaniferula spumae TaxID=2979115 RepID=A0AAT9FI10_9BACT
MIKAPSYEELKSLLLESDHLKSNEDAGAIVCHLLREPNTCPPKLKKPNYKGLISVIQGYLAEFEGRLCSGDGQIALDFGDRPSNFQPPETPAFKFIDLFAGIGGFRLAFQQAGGECVFTSEWDRFAKQTYERNFGEVPYGDITQISEKEIPMHDVLCAGFPCQPFSLAGVSKKNSLGKKHGFDDETQGTLFFDIKRIIKHCRPKAFMLENVKNLLSHDKGKTFEVIRKTLVDELGYVIRWKIVNGANWVPQNRQRIFIVGYDPDQVTIEIDDIIIPTDPPANYKYPELSKIISKNVEGHTLGPGTWDTLIRHKANHAKKGNGFGYGIHTFPIGQGEVTRTISARYHKDGAEILVEQNGDRPRRLTVKEAMQLQGYDPKKFVFPVSNTQAYRQIGNSVAVPAVQATAMQIAEILNTRSI